MLFSAGVEGFIKKWVVPMPGDVNMYGSTDGTEITSELW
jgi:hypothetical protein